MITNKYDHDSSQSERSLRISEDSTMEQRAVDTSSHLDNCDSAKTPLNDEHSTESAPNVEKWMVHKWRLSHWPPFSNMPMGRKVPSDGMFPEIVITIIAMIESVHLTHLTLFLIRVF